MVKFSGAVAEDAQDFSTAATEPKAGTALTAVIVQKVYYKLGTTRTPTFQYERKINRTGPQRRHRRRRSADLSEQGDRTVFVRTHPRLERARSSTSSTPSMRVVGNDGDTFTCRPTGRRRASWQSADCAGYAGVEKVIPEASDATSGGTSMVANRFVTSG